MLKLILLRHGQSLWNLENKFTGWTDLDDNFRAKGHYYLGNDEDIKKKTESVAC